MTRCIAILTLTLAATLIAAVDADEAFAADVTQDTYLITNSSTNYGPRGVELFSIGIPEDGVGWVSVENWHPWDWDLDALIAIIAFEDGPEAAYLTLIDMGFSPALAEDMVLEAIAIYGVRRYLAGV